MRCPDCGSDTKVRETVSYDDRVRRRRECVGCGRRFTTDERPRLSAAEREFRKMKEWWETATDEERRDAVMEWEGEVRLLSRRGDPEASEMADALAELKAGRPNKLLRQEAKLRAEYGHPEEV